MDETQVITNNDRVKVLANGAVYDLDKKRIVANPGGGSTAITSQRASELHARRRELKQLRIMEGAAKLLERTGEWTAPDDMDVVEAIGEAAMMRAMDPKAKGQIEAAKFILVESGLSAADSQRENASAPPGTIVAAPGALVELLDLLERQRSAAVDRSRAVDVESTDTRNE
jgi:hypothetical protein